MAEFMHEEIGGVTRADFKRACEVLAETQARAEKAEAERDQYKGALSASLAVGEVERQALREAEAERDRLREALTEVMTWIGNWAPDFIYDDEWSATEEKARAALEAGR